MLVVSLMLFISAAWWLLRTLPVQNVAMIFAVLVGVELAMEFAYDHLHFHSGPLPNLNFQLTPLLYWPGVLVGLRMSVRWILRQFGLKNYGIWLVLIVSVLATLVQWWIAPRETVGRAICTPLVLALLAPWFVSKLPYQPHHQA